MILSVTVSAFEVWVFVHVGPINAVWRETEEITGAYVVVIFGFRLLLLYSPRSRFQSASRVYCMGASDRNQMSPQAAPALLYMPNMLRRQ
jgi:hypothetical protein